MDGATKSATPEGTMTWYEHFLINIVNLLLRVADLAVLLIRPRLLIAYLRLWWLALVRSPYYWPRSFDSVLARTRSRQGRRELVYGETPLVTALYVLRKARLGRGEVFVDLTAGRGRPLLAAAWLGAHARGVELLSEHYDLVVPVLGRVGIDLACGDGATADIRDAACVYLAGTGFEKQTRQRFIDNLTTLPAGARVVTVDQVLDHPGFDLVSRHEVPFTWGFEPVWIYVRVERP